METDFDKNGFPKNPKSGHLFYKDSISYVYSESENKWIEMVVAPGSDISGGGAGGWIPTIPFDTDVEGTVSTETSDYITKNNINVSEENISLEVEDKKINFNTKNIEKEYNVIEEIETLKEALKEALWEIQELREDNEKLKKILDERKYMEGKHDVGFAPFMVSEEDIEKFKKAKEKEKRTRLWDEKAKDLKAFLSV